MADFRPLNDDSVSILYFDASVSPTMLYEAADYRMEVAFQLLDEMSSVKVSAGDGFVPALSAAVAMIMRDARQISSALYGVLLDHEIKERRAAQEDAVLASAKDLVRDLVSKA